MKTINIKVALLGNSSKQLKVNVDEIKTLIETLDENYQKIFSFLRKNEYKAYDFYRDWINFNTESLQLFNSQYRFYYSQNIHEKTKSIHLIDKIKILQGGELFIGNSGPRSDDRILVFLFENFEKELDEILETGKGKDLKRGIINRMEKLLNDMDSHILFDSYSRSVSEHRIRDFVIHLIPSTIWFELENLFYKKFILYFANQIFTSNHCIDHLDLEDKRIVKDAACGGLDDLISKIQHLMLMLLSIPEVFARNISPSYTCTYFKCLKDIDIKELPEKNYKNVINKSISEIYRPILESIPVKDYFDYIEYCSEVELSDINVSKIIHTFRILFNRLKHSSSVQIIRSRDEEKINRVKLVELDERINELNAGDERINELNACKEVIKKVRCAYSHLDFDDQNFKENNGIKIFDKNSNAFTILLSDLEFSFKILIGILCILKRSNVSDTNREKL